MFPSSTEFNTTATLEANSSALVEDLPFHILFLGDWSGKDSRAINSDLSDVKPIEIDRDNFDVVLNKFNVSLALKFNGEVENTLSLDFQSLDDFHPDNIFKRLPLFSELRDIRRQLTNSKTYNRAAREVKSWFGKSDNQKIIDAESKNNVGKDESLSVGLLDAILQQSDEENVASQDLNTQSSELGVFIKNIVKPHLIEIDTAEQSELLMVVDEIISDLMRKILHHPHFQSLESAWRGAFFLVKRIETASNLKIFLLDIAKVELISNLKDKDLTNSNLYDVLSRQHKAVGEDGSWSVIGGNYSFSLDVENVAALVRLASIADKLGISFVSHIKPEMFGHNSFESVDSSDRWKIVEGTIEDKLWTTLRVMPEAKHLGLAVMRVLGRLPYGADTNPAEEFYFEEFNSLPSHEKYLWLNPAFAIVLLLAQTFSEYGWDMAQKFSQDIDGLPLHLYQEAGENKTKSCAEISITQTNCETVLEQGLIPLISNKNTDQLKITSFQSVAYPTASLSGKWR